MNKFYYDLHIHSCLSPCADDESTPNDILGMSTLNELDIIALTDHNTAKNCPALFGASKNYDVIPIAGMELTTSEDIHVVCLFEKLDDALDFSDEIEKHRMLIENRSDIFGRQLIMDENDNVIGEEKYLLSNATDISFEDVPKIVKQFNGICYPAHIDREANGVVSILGTFPKTPYFSAYEIRNMEKSQEYAEKYDLSDKIAIFDSDAHYLTDINERSNFIELDCSKSDADLVRKQLFKYLRGEDS